MAKPLVSVISAYYNREDYVKESIQSLLDQTYENLEIIIIDDGSTDNTFKRLSEFSDHRLKVITHENIGLVRSFRKAIEMSSGEYIAVHGSGDISLPERIGKQIDLLQERPEIGVVGCYVEETNTFNGHTYLFRPEINESAKELIRKRNPFTHGEVTYRRNLYEQVGGYRPFFRYAQDRDLWARMSPHTEFAVVEEVLYRRFLLSTGVSLSLDKLALQRYLSDFAVQCLESHDAQGRDFIDLHGSHAPFFRQRSREVAKGLWRLAGLALLQQNIPLAQRFNQQSVLEARTPLNTLTQGILALIAKQPIAAKAFFRLLFSARKMARSRRTNQSSAGPRSNTSSSSS